MKIKEDILDKEISILLYPFSILYEIAVRLRFLLYKKNILKSYQLPGFVLSIGNITVGGTGKTPVVIKIADLLKKRGISAGIISRGYMRKSREMLIVSDKTSVFYSGDEPYLMAKRLKDTIICVGIDRKKAADLILKKYGIDFFILDDAFQNLRIKKNLDIVLIDGNNPFGSKRLLPSGPLREPIDHLNRADTFIIMGNKKIPSEIDSKKEIFFGRHVAKKIVFLNNSYPVSFLKNKKIVSFAGIGRPKRFLNTLKEIGAEVLYFKEFPDHYWFSKKDIGMLLDLKEDLEAEFLITTEKDWVRITEKKEEIGYVEIDVELEEEEKFLDLIISRYEEYKKNIS